MICLFIDLPSSLYSLETLFFFFFASCVYCRYVLLVCLWLVFSLCDVFRRTDDLSCNKVKFLTFMAHAFYSLLGMSIFQALDIYCYVTTEESCPNLPLGWAES